MRTMSARGLLNTLIKYDRSLRVMYLYNGIPIPIVGCYVNETSVALNTRELDLAITVGHLVETLLDSPPLAKVYLASVHNPEPIRVVRLEGKVVILKDLETNFK